MTGTGTQADPYIVTTWAEFVTATQTSGAYIKQGADIDMNVQQPQGISQVVNMRCAEFDGNGHEIKNAYFIENGQLFLTVGFGNLKRLKLINFYSASTSNAVINELFGVISDLEISGFILNETQTAVSGDRKAINGLSANIECHGVAFGGSSDTNALEISNGNINIDGGGSVNCVYINNCHITGKINNIHMTFKYDGRIAPNVCIIDADISGRVDTYAAGIQIYINSDRISPEAYIQENFNQATTEQLHDAAYLRAQGFPIGVD